MSSRSVIARSQQRIKNDGINYSKLFGRKRYDQFNLNGVDPHEAYLYFIGKLKPNRVEEVERLLLGLEFNSYWQQVLKDIGSFDIKVEKQCGKSKIDVVASVGRRGISSEKYKMVRLNKKEKLKTEEIPLFLKPGDHAYEAKTSEVLHEKALIQLENIARNDPDKIRHIVLLKHAKIPLDLALKLDKMRKEFNNKPLGDIIIAPITLDGLKRRFDEVKRRCLQYEEERKRMRSNKEYMEHNRAALNDIRRVNQFKVKDKEKKKKRR